MLPNPIIIHDSFVMLNPDLERDRDELLDLSKQYEVEDSIELQLNELVGMRSIGQNDEFKQRVKQSILNGKKLKDFGQWAVYPWLNKMVHVLPEAEFSEVRANRNLHKITKAEQTTLRTKRIGVVGLSVGFASLLNLATESIGGVFFISDFDTVDLSNLNRIQAGVQYLNKDKCLLAQQRLQEMNPYISLKTFNEGLFEENIESFLCPNGAPLDILIEECDNLELKIRLRLAAKKFGIPVIMETSDRGMLDIERFDLDQGYPIFHGCLSGLDLNDLDYTNPVVLKDLFVRIVNPDQVSERGQISLTEMGKSIQSWPQLMSDVGLGAAVITNTARRILLGEPISSGRTYIDLNELIN